MDQEKESPDATLEDVQAILDNSRRRFLRTLAVFGIISAPLWPLTMYLFHLGEVSLLFNGVILILSIILYLVFTYAKNLTIGYWCTVTAAFFILILINFFPQESTVTNNASWIPFFPIVAMFLLNKRPGILMTLLYFFVVVGIFIVNLFQIPGNQTLIFTIIFSLGTTIFLLYSYKNIEENIKQLTKQREEELERMVIQLGTVTTKLQDNLMRAAKQKEELENMNKLMVGRELAMADLKKRVSEEDKQPPNNPGP